MVAEDRRQPVDAIVFLGDNFYTRGLLESQLIERVRENLVVPYCHFAELSGPRSPEVAGGCREPLAQRHPVPLHALLGNHDYMEPESPTLQREVVPHFLPNWQVIDGPALVAEIAEGLSLILVETNRPLNTQERQRVSQAIRRARGPFRIVASHYSIVLDAEGFPASDASEHWLWSAVQEAGASVQLTLAGHEHNLQQIETPGAPPALHAIAGSGARANSALEAHPTRLYGERRLGFIRVDLIGDGREGRLYVTSYATAALPVMQWGEASVRARYSVGVGGDVRREFALASGL